MEKKLTEKQNNFRFDSKNVFTSDGIADSDHRQPPGFPQAAEAPDQRFSRS
jgi:hypothetical protein